MARFYCGHPRIRSSTNRRIAEERFPFLRFLSISATTFDSVACWAFAIFLRSSPERVFEADTGLVSINDNGSFDDHGLHGCALTGCEVTTILVFRRQVNAKK